MIGRLREMPLFAGLSDLQLEALARCVTPRTFGKGVFIYHKDGPGRTLYVIYSGRVRLFVLSDMGQEITVDSLGPSDVFGTLAVLDGQPHHTGAVAMETTLALMLPRIELLHSLDVCPALARNLMVLLTARMRQSMRYIEALYHDEKNVQKALVVADALYCGLCRPQEDPVPLPQLT